MNKHATASIGVLAVTAIIIVAMVTHQPDFLWILLMLIFMLPLMV